VIENFTEQTGGLYSDTINHFIKRSADLVVEGSGWGEQVVIHEKEFESQLRNLIHIHAY
jgi:hypothetical protein